MLNFPARPHSFILGFWESSLFFFFPPETFPKSKGEWMRYELPNNRTVKVVEGIKKKKAKQRPGSLPILIPFLGIDSNRPNWAPYCVHRPALMITHNSTQLEPISCSEKSPTCNKVCKGKISSHDDQWPGLCQPSWEQRLGTPGSVSHPQRTGLVSEIICRNPVRAGGDWSRARPTGGGISAAALLSLGSVCLRGTPPFLQVPALRPTLLQRKSK